MRLKTMEQAFVNQICSMMRMHPEERKFKNCIRLPYHTTKQHDEGMFHVCSTLMRNPENHRIVFWTECRLGTGRADIFYINIDLRLYGVVEVLVSEKDDNMVNKRMKYKCPVIPYRAGVFDYKRVC